MQARQFVTLLFVSSQQIILTDADSYRRGSERSDHCVDIAESVAIGRVGYAWRNQPGMDFWIN